MEGSAGVRPPRVSLDMNDRQGECRCLIESLHSTSRGRAHLHLPRGPLHHPRVSVSRPDQRGLSSASGTPRAPSGLTGLTVTGPVPSLPFSPSLAADAAETLPNPRAT